MYDQKANGFCIERVVHDLQTRIPKGSAIIMQTCANNPTGIDPTEEEWRLLSKICKERQLFPILDSAYVGFVTGNVYADASPIRIFMDDGHSFVVTQSFSKNMAMYGERLGVVHLICKDSATRVSAEKYFR